jgi:hypothetical protein
LRHTRKVALRCFNIVNPKPSPWGHLPAVVKQYHAEWGLTVVGLSLDESLKELRAVDETKAAEHANHCPALKLLDFFEGLKAGVRTEHAASRQGRESNGARPSLGWALSINL